MSDEVLSGDEALHALKRMFETGKAEDVTGLLAEDVVLLPPTYGKTWQGRGLVARLLGFAAEVLGGLRYTALWHEGDDHVLRFEGMIGSEEISGVDIVRLDADGYVSRFEIFARPPRAVLLLRDAMGERVKADPQVVAWMGLGPS